MDYFKSNFLKVLIVFIVLFPFISGGPKEDEAIRFCEDIFNNFFGLDNSLLLCVETAIYKYTITVIDPLGPDPYPTFNIWDSLQKSSNPMNIELKEQFCGRIGEMENEFFAERNPNSDDCVEMLGIFEIGYSTNYVCEFDLPMSATSIRTNWNSPENIGVSNIVDPNGNLNILSNGQYISAEDYDLKKIILCNALYHHDLSSQYRNGTYGGAYMKDIARKVDLINGNDYTPRRFCYDEHKEKE